MPEPLKIVTRDPRVTQLSTDTLENVISGLGTSRDKRTHGRFIMANRIDRYEAGAMYRNDWLAASVIDTIPDDMTREWRTITGLQPSQIDAYVDAEQHYMVREKLLEALKWSRLYGGAGVVLGIDGAGEFWEPLDLDRVKKGSLKWMQVVDRNYLIPERIEYHDPSSPNYQMPEHYRMFSGPDPIHRSRILIFHGVKLPYELMAMEHFWGASILDRVRDAIMNSSTVVDGIASLVLEAKVDVFKIPDLFSMMTTPEGTKLIMQRIALAQQGKSIVNAVLMDTAEEYEQKTDALAQGLAPLVEQYLSIVAAAADIPVTRLLGTSAKGLSATGEGDLRNYYDAVSSQQEDRLGPRLRQLDEVLLRSTFGTRPADFDTEWRPLWQMDEKTQAETELLRAQRDQAYLSEGIVESYHVAAQLVEEGTYSALEGDHVNLLKAEALEPEPEPPPSPAPGLPDPNARPDMGPSNAPPAPE